MQVTSSPLRPRPQRGFVNARTGCKSLAFFACPPCRRCHRADGGRLRGASHPDTPWGRVDQWPCTLGLRLSFEDTFQIARSRCLACSCQGVPRGAPWPDLARLGTPLLGLSNIAPPSTSVHGVHSRSAASLLRAAPKSSPLVRSRLRRRPRGALRVAGRDRRLRPGDAILRTRSVLAVLPDFDGLLRQAPCRSVAPCCRSWGSPRFRTVVFAAVGPFGRRAPEPVLRALRCTLPACRNAAVAEAPESRRLAGALALVARSGVLPRWRQTLRSFSLASSRTVSPRPMPSRR